MGELLLCNESITAMPYYMEGLGLNIYSLEELSYYISRNVYLLDQDFICEDLCEWIEAEVKQVGLAEELRKEMKSSCRLSVFVFLILRACGYCTNAEIQQIVEKVQEIETKSEYERSKFRADQLLEKNKCIAAIYEYRLLLEYDRAQSENAVTVGNVWHNMGTAYARLFLFQEASNCYLNAYKKNERHESLIECLRALFCCQAYEKGSSVTIQIRDIAAEYQVDEEQLMQIQKELSDFACGQDSEEFQEKLKELDKLNVTGDKQIYQEEIHKLIYMWKEEYRRISRI